MLVYKTDLGFSDFTLTELDAIALEKGGELGSISYGHATNTGTITPNGDWSAQWIDRRGMGNHGTLVLVALSPRTRALKREGTLRQWVSRGLKRADAEKLYAVNVKYKFELAEELARILEDEAARRAFLAHPGKYGPGSGRGEWRERWEGCLPEITLTAPREASLAQMVQAIAR